MISLHRIDDGRTAPFLDIDEALRATFLRRGKTVHVGEWQSVKQAAVLLPQMTTIELTHVVFEYPIPPTMEELQDDVRPNLPFAEAQFEDRVSGQPLNPPPSDELWPWAHHLGDDKATGKYSHTYPERFWPKQAGDVFVDGRDMAAESKVNVGLRYPYGDLGDLVSQLRENPATRQAYLPVWFPEDTGAVHGERVPCSLGYHFLIRDGKVDCDYFIRSVDFYRHFPDDVYMACRLVQWIADRVDANVGNLVMHIGSLHVFEAERKRLDRPRRR